ncbi:aspartyl-tRNA(Asn)/glutamyl-tRNA(Gln) amidotransferase subunit A [Roseovarius nanhaiticus]|uniref:Aspartyl-tRNA(Asn)/glutamyl-tRNA(Gln) amidotransferase subunit A n=1 Tax=Roseovarius nanhaiticus TaxID=573024 RepID=A0A1N7F5P8_9RHOB|nr:amidase family protein [Roseovarius nanhaiticus]SEK61113.1 aspartyl-tRNA(Asn)/glutamyl-tRNA(Gln) amidotransferase subunit A [Roseovarius nanhaiticus]SIR95697.1 aspartyl-tRNA(Asn)/glutamyl-tRNA(Gln) amidotransferase subunit A [Roseovarius nanhaiticus]
MQDWLYMSAADLGRGIDVGRIDAAELTEAYLAAIAAHPAARRIYSATTEDRARAEAQAAARRAREGQRRGPLDGVPISWKDLFDSAGTATQAGSRLLEGRVPARDAEVLANATAAGLVCLGKTHMSELAFSGLGLNPMTATPPCVNDAEAVAGGSSSGAAASVAHGLAAAGIGSDTGGSVRVPAAWNDLVGLKTTAGRVSCKGAVPLAARFDTVGPLTRTVEDAALLLAVLEDRTPVDLRGASLTGMRLAMLQSTVMDDLRDAPAAAYDAACARLEAAGAALIPVTAPEVDEAMGLSATLFSAEAYGTWGDVIEADPGKMFGPIRDRFRGGKDVSAPDFVAAWQLLDRLRGVWATRMAGYDAALMPSAPNLPPDANRLMEDGAYYVTENLLTLRNTRVGNLMGLAAITLPTGVPSCGIMLCGAAMGEARLLRVAQAAETALR